MAFIFTLPQGIKYFAVVELAQDLCCESFATAQHRAVLGNELGEQTPIQLPACRKAVKCRSQQGALQSRPEVWFVFFYNTN